MTAPGLRRLLIVCFGASGAAALIYQVAWVRLLTLSLGHTVAAASTVLAAFMGGLALGAWAAGRAADKRTTTLAVYAGLELFIAATAIALPAILASFDPFLVRAYADGTAPASFAIARIAVSFLLIGVPAAAMGATYPIAVAWLARIESARRTQSAVNHNRRRRSVCRELGGSRRRRDGSGVLAHRAPGHSRHDLGGCRAERRSRKPGAMVRPGGTIAVDDR